jgi:uncharacterized protein with FMN-binding domain
MRRVIAAIALTIAGLIPVWRYHPGSATQASGGVHVAAPAQSNSSTTTTPPVTSSGSDGQKTVDGPVVQTEFGPYQVQATLSGSKIVDVQLITEPGDRHSQRIAAEAEPTLKQEALQAQSAHIDTVSGATATSEAYEQSLQAALDGAR